MEKLTWIEGQNASWEGVEMTDENMMNRFGCLEIIYNSNDEVIGFITIDGMFRVGNSERDVILDIIKEFTIESNPVSFDNQLDEAHGFGKDNLLKQIISMDELMVEIKNFIWIKEIPESIKIKDIEEFMDALDLYFETK